MTIELDSVTGLPVLPEGYFWRIKPKGKYDNDWWGSPGRSASTHVLELRRKVLFFSRYVEGRYIVRSEDHIGWVANDGEVEEARRKAYSAIEEWGRGYVSSDGGSVRATFYAVDAQLDEVTILWTAEKLLTARNDRLKKSLDQEAEALRRAAFEGDYPPRSLNK